MSDANGSGYRVALVGATGAVGTAMLDKLEERAFPASEIVPFASERSAGRELRGMIVQPLTDETIQGFDVAIFSAGATCSGEWAPRFARAGALVVDNSSRWRMEPDVPLVVAEVNPEALDDAPRGIIANPNCSTMQLVPILMAIRDSVGLERVVVDTYQAVSGTGGDAIAEFEGQIRAHVSGQPKQAKVYPHPIAFNALPQVDVFLDNGYTKEEWKVVSESRKILHLPDLRVSCTAVRVPVFVSHSEAVHVETREPLSPERARELFAAVDGVVIRDDPATSTYPLASEAAGSDNIFVGRVRHDPSIEDGRGVAFWVVSDNLRKGAATNAVQIAEELIRRGWVKAAAARGAQPYGVERPHGELVREPVGASAEGSA